MRGKGKRRDRLPLLVKDVGEALATYLRHGRPAYSARHVFVRLYAPHRGFASSSDISTIVRQAIGRAGLHPPCKGEHLLRHTLATHMQSAEKPMVITGSAMRTSKAVCGTLCRAIDYTQLIVCAAFVACCHTADAESAGTIHLRSCAARPSASPLLLGTSHRRSPKSTSRASLRAEEESLALTI